MKKAIKIHDQLQESLEKLTIICPGEMCMQMQVTFMKKVSLLIKIQSIYEHGIMTLNCGIKMYEKVHRLAQVLF